MADQNATDGETLPVGNKLYEEMLIREGKLGVWFTGDRASDPYVWAEIVPEVFRRSVRATTAGVLRLLAGEAGTDDAKIDSAASSITDAVCVMAFLKVRSVNLMVDGHDERYIVRPRVPEPFETPLPFAAAVSRLGAVEVRDLTRRMVAVPAIPADSAASWLLEPGRAWDLDAYARATAFARSLGVQFATVDVVEGPKAGTGTAWWLLRGAVNGGRFSMRCVLPESNYTEEDALLHSMFCLDEQLELGASLFQLDGVAQGDYGSVLRNPHAGINVNTFLALSDEPLRSMWKIG